MKRSNTKLLSNAYILIHSSIRVVNKLIFQVLGKPIVRFFINHELILDKAILENIIDKDIPLKQMQLGRFDGVLAENRKRINRIYRNDSSRVNV